MLSTTASLRENPGTKAFVESLTSKVTPLFDSSIILSKSALGPIGVKSNLKSPVVTIIPLDVVTAIPKESGTE